LKVIGSRQLVHPLLELLDLARRDVDLSFDQYPYGAGSTMLSAVLPGWAQDGGGETVVARLKDPEARRRIREDVAGGLPGWENLFKTFGPENIVIVHAGGEAARFVGRSVAEIGDEAGKEPLDAALDLLVEAGLEVAMVDHYATEEMTRAIFKHPLALVGSDGIFGLHPHPRLYGTAARALGRYAIRERLVSVEEAVARLTSKAADRLRLADRGRIRPGLRADLVLLEPNRYVDTATYDDPMRLPDGVEMVVAGGHVAWRQGRATGARPGGVLRTALAEA
jgi:N-acyl-D-amino-acid deacylase